MAEETTEWVSTQDIHDAAFGLHLSENDNKGIQGLIRLAEQKVRNNKSLQVEKRIKSGALSVEAVRSVVIDMVLRVIKNPDGLQSDGVGSASTAYFRGSASGAIELLKEDIQALRPTELPFGTMKVAVPGWRLP